MSAPDLAEALEALRAMVTWHGRRDNRGDDRLLPPEVQEAEVACAMRVLDKHGMLDLGERDQ